MRRVLFWRLRLPGGGGRIERGKKRIPELPFEDDVTIWIESEHFGNFGQWFAREMVKVVARSSEEVLAEKKPSCGAKMHVHLDMMKGASMLDWGVWVLMKLW